MTRTVTLGDCAKCGQTHNDLTFHPVPDEPPAPPGFHVRGYKPKTPAALKEVAVCPVTHQVIAVWHADEWEEPAPCA